MAGAFTISERQNERGPFNEPGLLDPQAGELLQRRSFLWR
jgi:hypothetical protein